MQGCANGQTLIAGGRLNPGTSKWSRAEELAVGDAVQSTPSGHREIFERHALMKLVEQMKENFFEPLLHGKSEIHFALADFGMGLAGRAKQLLHARRKVSSQLYGAIGQNLHALVTAERLKKI